MIEIVLAAVIAVSVPVEKVLALVNGAPILASDRDLALVAEIVPRGADEDEDEYLATTAEALITLELRWQDLAAAGIDQRLQVDEEAAWQTVAARVGGEDELRRRLETAGLTAGLLRNLVRRAVVVESYVRQRFSPFTRPTRQEIDSVYHDELVPAARAKGEPVPTLEEVRGQIEALVRERKLTQEVERWTRDLEQRGVVVRYSR